MRALVSLCLALGLALAASPAGAQDADVLRRELDQLRQQFDAMKGQYQKAIDSLTERLRQLAEHLRGMLVGSLLAVRSPEVARVAALYGTIGLFHWLCRRPFFLISTDPDAAFRDGWRVRLWGFLFYASFGLVVTSSVRIAGVLLVFSYLIVPALAGIAFGGPIGTRLWVGWAFGTVVSVIGMVASAAFDLPTGATVACAFGVTLLAWGSLARPLRRQGAKA